MNSLAQALNIGIPFFIVLMAIEFGYGILTKNNTYNIPDTVSSISSGLSNITKSVLGLVISLISYSYIYNTSSFIHFTEAKWWMYPLVFIVIDFAGYWIHRFEHVVNYFWNRHVIHHSSEEYNLACALRQSISEIFSLSIFLIFPLALLGIPPSVIYLIAPIHLFMQFWYHTRHIKKMGWLEHIIVTPSHHRVHHAINDEYIDKNFSQIFIFWDKLFGTFQKELDAVPAVYGTKKPAETWNPIVINFQHAYRVWKDFLGTKSIKDKAKIWFMPTGWRPKDMQKKYPISTIEDVYKQKKYSTQNPIGVKAWAIAQVFFILFIALYLFNHLNDFNSVQSIAIASFIFASIYSYTSILDGNISSFYLEILVSTIGIIGSYYLWENQSIINSNVFLLIAIFQAICIFNSLYFLRTQSGLTVSNS